VLQATQFAQITKLRDLSYIHAVHVLFYNLIIVYRTRRNFRITELSGVPARFIKLITTFGSRFVKNNFVLTDISWNYRFSTPASVSNTERVSYSTFAWCFITPPSYYCRLTTFGHYAIIDIKHCSDGYRSPS